MEWPLDTIRIRAVKRFDLNGQFITEKSPPFDAPRSEALQHIALGNCIRDDGATRKAKELPPPSSAPEPDDDMPALRAAYTEKLGKRPFAGWDAEELKRRMDEADE